MDIGKCYKAGLSIRKLVVKLFTSTPVHPSLWHPEAAQKPFVRTMCSEFPMWKTRIGH